MATLRSISLVRDHPPFGKVEEIAGRVDWATAAREADATASSFVERGELWLGLGGALHARSRFREASEAFREAVSVLAKGEEHNDEARQCLTEALLAWATADLVDGIVPEEVGDAMLAHESAVQPDDPDIWRDYLWYVAPYLERVGRGAEAVVRWEQLIAACDDGSSDETGHARSRLTSALFRLRRYSDVERVVQEMLESSSSPASMAFAHYMLGMVRLEQNRLWEARAEIGVSTLDEHRLQRHERHSLYIVLARIEEREGEYEGLQLAARRALEHADDDDEVRSACELLWRAAIALRQETDARRVEERLRAAPDEMNTDMIWFYRGAWALRAHDWRRGVGYLAKLGMKHPRSAYLRWWALRYLWGLWWLPLKASTDFSTGAKVGDRPVDPCDRRNRRHAPRAGNEK